MKKRFIPIVISSLFTALIFSGCDNASSTPEVDGADLVGVWTVTSASATNCDDADENGNFTTICTSTDCLKVEFKADGTFVSTDLEDGVTATNNGTYTVSGSQITITEGMEVQVATFTIEDNMLNLQGNEAETGCDVSTSLTKDS